MATTRDLPPVADGKFLERVREDLQRLIGSRGGDRALRIGDVGSMVGGFSPNIVIQGGGSGGASEEPDLTPPPSVSSLTAMGGITQVIVTWAGIGYTQGHGNKQTLIYAVKKEPSDTAMPTSGDAQLVAVAPHALTLIALPSEPNTRWHIWAKFESIDGVLSAAFSGGTNGVQATTGQDVTHLMEVMTGQIRESHLYSTLGSRIGLIDAADTVAGSVSARVKAEADARAVAITLARSDFAAADALILTTANAYVGTYAYARSSVDSALSAQSTSIRADFAAADASTLASATSFTYSRAAIDGAISSSSSSLTAAYAAADSAVLASADAASASRDNSVLAAANAYTYARSTIDGAIASSASTLTANYGSAISAAVAVESSARASLDGAVQALYTVRAEVSSGGRTVVGGFGFSGTATATQGPRIDFGVRADTFYVEAPSGGSNPTGRLAPFIIRTTTFTEGGVSVPAGVYMDAAYIVNLTAMYARIGSLVADDISAAAINVAQLVAGSMAVGAYAQSTGFVSGSSGWRISGNGVAEFSGVVVRGTIFATAGLIGGNTIDATGIQSPVYIVGSTGWRADTSGMVRAFAGGGTRVLDLAATGSSPVLKIGSALELLANGEAFVGAVSIGAAGHVRRGQTAYNSGTGFWIGDDAGTPKMSIGNSSGPNLRWTGSELLISGHTFDLFSASINGGDMSVNAPNGFSVYGSKSVVIIGGKSPYKYVWQVTPGISYVSSTPYRLSNIASYGGSNESSVTLCGISELDVGQTLRARVTCHVTDANGRATLASFLLTALHAPAAGGSYGGGGEGGSDP